MPTLPTEQLSALQTANVELLFGLTNKTITAFEKLVELNLQTIKATVAETQDNIQKAFAAKDIQELLALQASLWQPATEKAQAYRRQWIEITSATRAEFAKVAEAQYEANKRKMQDVIDNATKSAPAGSEAAVAAWQSAVSATTTLCDTMQQTTKQAIEVAESNLDIAAAAASNAARQATAQAARGGKR
ncbi:TIGR01841 family phasin [Cupriavidus sp. NPDC089707]|uniref:TIGR01841 family phasin n=1 Tax=Cupriavidus sp. NPDC089707 TaxID=3363963 RepID=UPI003801CFBC